VGVDYGKRFPPTAAPPRDFFLNFWVLILVHSLALLSAKLLLHCSTSDPDVKTYILQGSVETQLRCGGTFNNYFIGNFPQSMRI